MALFNSNQVTGVKPQVSNYTVLGGDLQFDFTAETPLTAADVLYLGTVPAGYRIKAITAIGSGASVTGNVDVGYLNDAKTAITSGAATLALPYALSDTASPWQAGDGGDRAIGLVGALAANKTVCVIVSIVRA